MYSDDPRALAIGLFDSGVGGLTVLREVAARLPYEQLIYFADTARLPYGEKSSHEIRRYAIENASFLMQCQPLKLLIVACNTAAAYSHGELQQHCPFPVIDVIEAGVDSVVKTTKNQRIAVLGTRGTIRSRVYEREILKILPEATVISHACPLLVPLVEEQLIDHAATRLILKDYLAPLKDANVDTVLLACTHYPLLRHLIIEELGDEVAIVDSAQNCAAKVIEVLGEDRLIPFEKDAVLPQHKFYVSDFPQRFSLSAKSFLGFSPEVMLKEPASVYA